MDPELANKMTTPVPTEDAITAEEFGDEEAEHTKPSTSAPSSSSNDERLWARIAHLSTLVGVIVPLGGIIAPLVIWRSKTGQSFVAHHATEALNFQICLFVINLFAAILTTVFVGFLLLPIFALVNIYFTVKAAIEAHDGNEYKYPFICRPVKQ